MLKKAAKEKVSWKEYLMIGRRKIFRPLMIPLLLLALSQVLYSIPLIEAENPSTFTTIGVIPTKLAVYLGPPTLPAESGTHYAVFVQLQDAAGNPAYAPAGGVGVSLRSSNTTVGTVYTSAIISAGTNFASTYFTATSVPGTTLITASAAGYTSGTATMTTVPPSLSPSKFAVYITPPKLPADNKVYYYTVTVQLQDATGKPAKAPSPGVTVSLASSNTLVGTVSSPITIPTGSTYAQTSLYTTYTSGSTLITAASAGYTSGSATMTTIATVPTKIAVYAAPQSVPADSSTHWNIIFVQLQDAAGNPARAPLTTGVSLISSNATVGTVQSPITISAGSTYATAYFSSTYTPGTTLITASAAGYTPGSVVMKTVAPNPTKLVVYPGPLLPADNGWHSTAAVQLQDTAGTPARAPAGGVSVTLTSSNLTVGTVSSPLTISAGSSFADFTFKATYTPGTTLITATSAGYATGTATMTTVAAAGTPSKLAVYSVPPKLPAESGTYYYPLIIQLQDAAGKPANAPTGGIGISLSSSNPSIGTVTQAITISGGSTYTRTWFDSAYTPGSTMVSAVASGYSSGSGSVTTTGATPAELAVYAGLPKVLADASGYHPTVVVQLQDAQGNPARAPAGGVGISLWSSNPWVGTVSTYAITLSAGSTYTSTWFYSTYTPGSTSVVASVSMLTSTLSLSVTPKTVGAGGTLTISIQLWPKISTQLYMYYRISGTPTWTLAPLTIITNSAGSYSISVSGASIPPGTYDLVVVWMGSATYKGAVSEIRTFTRV